MLATRGDLAVSSLLSSTTGMVTEVRFSFKLLLLSVPLSEVTMMAVEVSVIRVTVAISRDFVPTVVVSEEPT